MERATSRTARIDRQGISDMRVADGNKEVDPVEVGKHPLADGGVIDLSDSQPWPKDGVRQQASGEGGGITGPVIVRVPESMLVVRASLSDHQHRARAAWSVVPGGSAERKYVHGCLVHREGWPLMGCGQCFGPDWARPAFDPSIVGGLAETGKESVRVGQHHAMMPSTRHHRGRLAGTPVMVHGSRVCATATEAGAAVKSMGFLNGRCSLLWS
jgi:hypothetical protein